MRHVVSDRRLQLGQMQVLLGRMGDQERAGPEQQRRAPGRSSSGISVVNGKTAVSTGLVGPGLQPDVRHAQHFLDLHERLQPSEERQQRLRAGRWSGT